MPITETHCQPETDREIAEERGHMLSAKVLNLLMEGLAAPGSTLAACRGQAKGPVPSTSPRPLPSGSPHFYHRKENLKQKDFMGTGIQGKRLLCRVQAIGADGERVGRTLRVYGTERPLWKEDLRCPRT